MKTLYRCYASSSLKFKPLWSNYPRIKTVNRHDLRHSNLHDARRGVFTNVTNNGDENNSRYRKHTPMPLRDNKFEYDPVCELSSSTLRYGPSSTSELGHDLSYLNAKRLLLFVDPHIAIQPPFTNVLSSIEKHAPKV